MSHRSTAGVALLLSALLDGATGHADSRRVQVILFPPHFQDEPNDVPKCKGFALVTLSQVTDVNQLLSAWPWDLQTIEITSTSEEAQEAAKSGLRTLSKTRWDQLQDEYAAYRQKLLAQAAESTHPVFRAAPSAPVSAAVSIPEPSRLRHEPPTVPTLTASAPYPPDCVVYVRHVHHETNKTTLRTLFSAAFRDHSSLASDGLDYVDYTKGLDTCYLRLTTPAHSQHLVSHFASHPTAQSEALDTTGAHSDQPMTVELLQGTKEEIYWGQVPEKVRRQAVTKAVSLLADGGEVEQTEGNEAGRKRRKRH
ncbi:hypothetical protein FA95DRAFT_1563242 [Auriscalpium vulgare]|uniref:Uncharacterized protein n=1 Tax=Auriscalpium vulgare TaxID=40419 RepID=A0ACB8RH44_9AGAM|nr:hypothetical protein FA95DRAFT_1563242 [Auriscalpium vulgare]